LFRRQLEFELLISAANPLPRADSMLKIPLPANGITATNDLILRALLLLIG
jgi:hypothetical protein